MYDDDGFIFIIVLLFGVLIGVVLSFVLFSLGSTEIVRTEVLDSSCQAIFGADYQWLEYETGVETKLQCEKVEYKVIEVVEVITVPANNVIVLVNG